MTFRVEALTGKGSLTARLWEREKRAKELGLALVLEVHAKKDPLSKAISRVWSKEKQLTQETLSGIYLVRVDLLAVGPKEAVALTPYALFGVPLFVAWNPLGQVLTRRAFKSQEPDEIVSVLSAYFEDVARGRKHELNPAPRIPSGTPSKPKRKRTAKALPPASNDAGERLPEADAEKRLSANDAAEPAPSAIELLARQLDAFLANALQVARAFLREHDLRDDESLHSLRQLDALLDENPTLSEASDLEGRALAAIGVYLGAVVRANSDAQWFVDTSEASPIEAVALRVRTPDGERVFRPLRLALDRLHDPDKGFYGHAIAMARKV